VSSFTPVSFTGISAFYSLAAGDLIVLADIAITLEYPCINLNRDDLLNVINQRKWYITERI
jgi:hypothetical protein